MKKTLFVIIYFIVATNNLYSQRIVKIGAFNYYPAIFQDKDGEIKGFYVDAFHEIEVEENIQIQYVFGTWDEGLKHLQNDEIDMMVSVAYNDDRATYMDFCSTPLLTVWGEVYVNKSSEIDDILGLEGKTIAVMRSDVNGEQLKILTNKMSINCIFIEKPDFQYVFESIVSNEVDAGVVNNTFGAGKSEEYDIRTSGIVFNPFDIHLTVHKNKNAELLMLFEDYLKTWKYDVNSVYNTSRQKWSHGKVGAIQIIPKWLKNILISIIGITIILLVFIVLLRYRVKKATIKVKNGEKAYRDVVETTINLITVVDNEGRLIFTNHASLIFFGLPPNECIGKFAFDFVYPGDVEITQNAFAEWINSNDNIFYLENRQESISGNILDVAWNINIERKEGEIIKITSIGRDITEQKKVQKELLIAKEKAEESDRLKSAFLANMSHEIRTPMNSILGFSNRLKKPDLSQESRDTFISYIQNNGEILMKLVNDIIDISKIESTQFSVKKEMVLVNDIINELLVYYRSLKIKDKIYEFVLQVPPGTENMKIFADNVRLRQLLINLIDNAVNYGNNKVEFGYTLNDKNSIQFFVKDNGLGIPKDKFDIIFERFFKLDTIKNIGGKKGVGLGLSICKLIVENFNGEIWLESEIGTGTTFYFTIPLTEKI
ncbi:MAG: transporter substrate-binding domain-containing protein [Paludibacter sp.]|nr:transporter substrate-binding domain-containing protein [Paludibacter sp.]